MSSVGEDEGEEARKGNFLNFSEEFRRSKRNLLFWAATTVLVSIGTFGSDGAIETSWAQNIRLPPWILVIASVLAMTYAAFEFWHAERRQREEYQKLGAMPHVQSAGEAASELEALMGTAKARLDEQIQAMRCINPATTGALLKAASDNFDEYLVRSRQKLAEMHDSIEAFNPVHYPPDIELDRLKHEVIFRISDIGNIIGSEIPEQIGIIRHFAVEFAEAQPKNLDPQPFVDGLETTYREAVAACKQVSTWASSVDAREVKIHNRFYRKTTWGIVGFAMFVAVVRVLPIYPAHDWIADRIHPADAAGMLASCSCEVSVSRAELQLLASAGDTKSGSPSPQLAPASGSR